MTPPAFITRLSPAEKRETRSLMIEAWILSPTQESAQDALAILKRRAPVWLLERIHEHPIEALRCMSAVVRWGLTQTFYHQPATEGDSPDL